MDLIRRLVIRDDSSSSTTFTPTIIKLLVALLTLVVLAMTLVALLFLIRKRRQAKQNQQSELPYHNVRQNTRTINHRRLTITASPYGRKTESVFVMNEKSAFLEQTSSPPTSPVPEIRITFPEEEDISGKRKSGRCVVVRISEAGGLGLEPYNEESLPPYQSSDSERFQSLDLERMGGLKEKELINRRYS